VFFIITITPAIQNKQEGGSGGSCHIYLGSKDR
jgi:hypothetical protein